MDRCVAAPGRSSAARSSSRDAGLTPVAPESTTASGSPRASPSACASAAATLPGLRRVRSDATPAIAASGVAPRARRVLARLQHQESGPAAEDEAAALGRAVPDGPERLLPEEAAHLVDQEHVRPLGVVGAADQEDVVLAGGDAGLGDRGSRRRRALSSPMKVREAPVTPCTIEMLPASRFESWARKSVGRRSLIRRSLRNTPGSAALRMPVRICAVDGVVALAAARRDDEVHAAFQAGVVLRAGGIEREPGGVDAEALPGLHLALVGLLRDLPVVVERHRRMDRVGREGRRVEPRRGAAGQRREMGVDALARRTTRARRR